MMVICCQRTTGTSLSFFFRMSTATAAMLLLITSSSLRTGVKAWMPASQRCFRPTTTSSCCRLKIKSKLGKSPIHYHQRQLVASMTSSSSSSSPESISTETSDKIGNLISLQQSLDLFGTKEKDGGKVLFVDASYYHKGNRNGREE